MVCSAHPRAHLLESVQDGRARVLLGAIGGEQVRPPSCTVLRIALLSFSAVPVGFSSRPAGADDLETDDASIAAATCAMLSSSTPCGSARRPTNLPSDIPLEDLVLQDNFYRRLDRRLRAKNTKRGRLESAAWARLSLIMGVRIRAALKFAVANGSPYAPVSPRGQLGAASSASNPGDYAVFVA